MLKLFRRLLYGNSSKKPIFVIRKNRWLYKNKWISYKKAINILSGVELTYGYMIKNTYYTVHSFEEVVNATVNNPMDIQFTNSTDFSLQELRVLANIRVNNVKDIANNFYKNVKDLEKQVNNLNKYNL